MKKYKSNTFRSSYKSMKLAYWLVAFTLMLLPWFAMSNALPLLLVLALFVVLMTINKIKGAPFVVMAIGLCLPFIAQMDAGMSVFFADHFKWLNRTIYVCILFMYLFIVFTRKQKSRLFPVSALVLVAIGMLLNGLRFGIGEGVSALFQLLIVPVMFYVCYKGQENWNDLFQMFTVFFLGMAVYAVLDFFFRIGPYVPLRMGSITEFTDFFRTGSLLGNSLCLTCFVMAYHSVLLINYYLTGKFNPLLISASILTLFLTGSRTAFIVLILVWLVFISYLCRSIKQRSKLIALMFIFAIILGGVVMCFLGDYVYMFLERFGEGSEHRASGFQTTWNIFRANPFGIGESGKEDAFLTFSTEGWSNGMATVDNVYLDFLITSGVLFFLPFLFYFFVPLNALSRSFQIYDYRMVVMLFIPYILCAMSFDVNRFISINALYFGMAGHMYRIIQQKNIYGFIDNNR